MNLSRLMWSAKAKLRNWRGYAREQSLFGQKVVPTVQEQAMNEQLVGYPRNHNYRLCGRQLLPSFELYERTRVFEPVYPSPLTSFLDIGCCRGYYVLRAATQPTCTWAAGIDVHEPFITTAGAVREYLGVQNARFRLATLSDVAEDPAAFGGPFQTVLLVGTYHYLFWGSSLSADALFSHREILSRLAKVCTHRLVFSGRLELGELPRYLRAKAAAAPQRAEFTTKGFLAAAAELFDVRQEGWAGRYRVYVMDRKAPRP
jgi:hypothetical protein